MLDVSAMIEKSIENSKEVMNRQFELKSAQNIT